jgi:hypothetical protein
MGPPTAPYTEDFLPHTLVCDLYLNFCTSCVNLCTKMQRKLFNSPEHQHVSNLRGTILFIATVVTIDFQIHHATRASSLSEASRVHHLPKSMVVSEAGNWMRATSYSLYPSIHAYSSYHMQWHDV